MNHDNRKKKIVTPTNKNVKAKPLLKVDAKATSFPMAA